MIKTLLKSVREYKRDSILAPIFVTLEVIMEVVIPLLMAMLIDKGIDAGNMNYILKIGIARAISCVSSFVFGALSGKFAASASAGCAKNLRKDMFYNVQNCSFSNIDKFSASSIVTRLTTDITNVQNAYQMIVRIAVRGPIMIIFSRIMAFGINHKLSLVFLLAIPVLGGGLYFIMTHAHPIFERVFKIYDKLNNVVQENLRGIRVVKSFVREDYEEKKFKNVSEDIYDDFVKAEKLLAFNAPLMQFAAYGCMLFISWFGAKLIVASTMTTGELTSLIAYTMQILMNLMMLSMVFVMITMARASSERIVEILDEKSDLTNPENPVYEIKNGDISFRNVNCGYSKKKRKLCLKNINLDIKSGETVGIIGGTGSSKSSLVQLIPRLYDTTDGEVIVGDRNVKEYDIESLRDEVAMVLQKNVLFSGTIKENLRWGNDHATDEEIERVCKLAQADEFIQTLPVKYEN